MSRYLLYQRISAYVGATTEFEDNGWPRLLTGASDKLFHFHREKTLADNRVISPLEKKLCTRLRPTFWLAVASRVWAHG